ncbi:MAG: thioredoxin domain-containing protein [Propionibacteriaceae bacterium]|nr:thioredoxin domain-containing protein [Propionibacteriaceae bacterium]
MSKKKPSNQRPAQASTAAAQAGRQARIDAIKREEQTKTRVTIAIVVVVALVVLGIVVALVANALRSPASNPTVPAATSSTSAPTSAPTGAPEEPATTTAPNPSSYSFAYGAGKVQVDLHFDFMCSACGIFERVNGEDLAALAANDTITLRMHPMNFLDSMSMGTQYSTRAASAFVAVANQRPDKALSFAALLWENQPAENTKGLTDDQIAGYARDAGVPDEVIATFSASTNATWVDASNKASLAAGVQGTPALVVDGQWISGKSGKPSIWAYATPGVVKSELETLAHG